MVQLHLLSFHSLFYSTIDIKDIWKKDITARPTVHMSENFLLLIEDTYVNHVF